MSCSKKDCIKYDERCKANCGEWANNARVFCEDYREWDTLLPKDHTVTEKGIKEKCQKEIRWVEECAVNGDLTTFSKMWLAAWLEAHQDILCFITTGKFKDESEVV